MQKAYEELIEKIVAGEVTKNNFEQKKIELAKKYSLGNLLKNAEIKKYSKGMKLSSSDNKVLHRVLKTKPVRSLSGVANIAIMWLGDNDYSCPFKCTYCPQGKYSPKSYLGREPATLRAKRNNYDPILQIKNRLFQLELLGHPTNKCELIIMGGTFMTWHKDLRENFIKGCYDAFNEKEAENLDESIMINEKADHRVVGLTIETRADYCRNHNIKEMFKYGCTRVEVGVQSTNDEILQLTKRGHSAEENQRAFALLRKNALKITAHWMPGLSGVFGKIDFDLEKKMFIDLFNSQYYKPDELKIYPALVIPGTELHEQWIRKEYEALTIDSAKELLIELKKIVPKYVRIKRMMRDIPEQESEAGASKTNLRQLIHTEMGKRKIECQCIRCREVGHKLPSGKEILDIELKKIEYQAAEGKEIFLSFEDVKNNIIVGFLRLRIDDDDSAKVRELHVYGQQIPVGKDSSEYQHKGFGKKLLQKAEELALQEGKKAISVTSGVGVRDYYRNLGYHFEWPYMVKRLC